MLTSARRALVTEIQDRLIELYVQQDEARRTEDRDRAHELQVEIAAQREDIRRWNALDRRKQRLGRIGNGKSTGTHAETARARERHYRPPRSGRLRAEGA
jgi:hypothetical protein